MSVFEVHGGPVDRRYLMKKTKYELATLVLELLKQAEFAAKPGVWVIRYPDGVVIPLIGETVPDCYAKYATPFYAKEKNHDAN